MAEFDSGFKIVARFSGPGLSRLGGIIPDTWEAVTDTVQTTERLADRVYRASCGKQRFVVYIEGYTRWVESAPWSVLAKSGLLSERERLPTYCLVFILLKKGYKKQEGTFRLALDAQTPTQQVWFKEVCLWEQKVEPWWEYHPGLMAMSPLCDHGLTTAKMVGKAADAIRQQSLDSYHRRELLTTLGIFGKLVQKDLDVYSIIRREEMRESPIAQDFVQEGEQKSILKVLEVRFGKGASKEFEKEVTQVNDADRLTDLLEVAVRCRRISQFRRAIEGK